MVWNRNLLKALPTDDPSGQFDNSQLCPAR
jgi:hypothetical protein